MSESMSGVPPTDRLADVYDATTRYLRTLDGLTPERLAEPSPLPGWSRAHVAAHLALHALGTTRALTGLARGERLPVYDSVEKRAEDIEATAALPADELRELSFDACDRWKSAIEAVEDWDGVMERTPGTGPFTAAECVHMRWREVEIHHADLDAGYGPADWPDAFTTYLLGVLVADRGREHDLTLRTPDRELVLGSGGPVVEGAAADLAWWLLGRGGGAGLAGEVPTLGPWR
jgi:maleylpyruvate isomerase